MSGFDSLIGRSLEYTIEGNLGHGTLEKIEQRLFEKYGMNLTKAVDDFPKLDIILREFFGDGAEGVERQLLHSIITIEQNKMENKEYLTIKDRHINKIILEAIGDDDKKNILNSVLDKPKIISQILTDCNIPQTSGYRKINNLIKNGLLSINGYETTPDGKIVNKYQSVFENIRIHIEKNQVVVQVLPIKEALNNSIILPIIRG